MNFDQEQFMRMQQYQYAARIPFYMNFPIQTLYTTEMEYERDMERMKEMYPDEARRIQKLVEEECDKMEYEGSMMFDEYPDRMMLKVICDRIYQNATAPVVQEQVTAEEVEAQQNRRPPQGPPPFGPPSGRPPQGPPPFGPPPGRPPQGPPHGRPGNSGLDTLIQVLLYNEMYKRRCRYRRCRNMW